MARRVNWTEAVFLCCSVFLFLETPMLAADPAAPKTGGPVNASLPAAWTKSLTWRSIGPANMSGRIVALAVYEADPTIWWAATASGGLLKTTNAGMTLEHQFDREATVSIGDVAVAPSNPNIVWVGTGENNPRNSVSYGDGVYKSTDGGKTWTNMGLKRSYQIGRVVIHPTNPDIVYVGVLGRLYGASEERGLYKTTDGGKSWSKILHVDDRTGVIDLTLNPKEPDTLLVASWERRRDGFDSWPGEVKKEDGYDGYDPIVKWAPGSALWRSTDGGKTFAKVTRGLPTGKLGRVGLDICRSNPRIVYAIIDCEDIGKGPAPLPVAFGAVCQDSEGKTSIRQLLPDSPASRSGLKVGDTLVEVGGKAVATFDHVLDQVRRRKPGEKLEVKYQRGGESRTATLALVRRPGAVPTSGTTLSPVFLGITGQDSPEGIRLLEITPESPASTAGLKAGDLVETFDGKKLPNYVALLETLRSKNPGDKITLGISRGTEKKTISATLAPRTGRTASRTRPYGAQLAGQPENVQDQQGSRGHEFGGIYRSEDGGESWVRVNSLNPRPMYFGQVRVDPSDPSKVYVLGVAQYRSMDGGTTFTPDFGRTVHADGHALWIDPRDGRHMLIGTDGGVYSTRDRGLNWDHFNHAAIGQFYHVAVSPERHYHVYGGLQDNGSWGGPSRTRRLTGPINEDWISVGGGDGFTCRVDPSDPDVVYWTSQNGNMMRRNLRTGEIARIRPTGAPLASFRFNWHTPYFLSAHNPRIFYAGSQYVLRSIKRGDELRIISPDLTLTKRGSMSALAESPRNPDVLWAGTDDGALWVTRNGGKDWTQVTKNLGLPEPRWVASIEASRFREGRAYVCLDGHRSDDDRPYLFMTDDYGQTWRSITANLPEFGSTRVLREDILREGLLYCGTEFGFYFSLDNGGAWNRLNTNLPTVAVHEVASHPTAGEIVAATHGRSLWILDVTALRQLSLDQVRGSKAALYRPLTAERTPLQPARGRTNRRFVGENPPAGASLWYAIPPKAEKVALRIVDIDGKTVNVLEASREPGLHRVVWNLTEAPARGGRRPGVNPARQPRPATRPIGTAFARPVPPGTYRVILEVDGQEFSQPLTVTGEQAAPTPPAGGDPDSFKG